MAAEAYASFPENALGGNTAGEGPIDILSDAIKGSLRNAYTANQTTHTLYGELGANESSATGYTAGGITLAAKTYSVTSLTTTFDNTADLVWTITAGTLATNAIVFYDDTVADPIDPLICQDTYGAQSVAGADFTWVPNASGIFRFVVAT